MNQEKEQRKERKRSIKRYNQFIEDNIDCLELLYTNYIKAYNPNISFDNFCKFAYTNSSL